LAIAFSLAIAIAIVGILLSRRNDFLIKFWCLDYFLKRFS
jgi:hypothetical protein